MKHNPNRLAPGDHKLAGAAIDRSAPLRFRLDGHTIHGFVGDTLLSAALASGFDAAGQRLGSPLALNERFAPTVIPAALAGDPQRALPLERTPAVDGLDLVTLTGRRRPLADATQRLLGRSRSLGNRLDGAPPLAGPWVDSPVGQRLEADLVVIGGGLAGLSAALAAGRRGASVIVIERRPWLGGDARCFGVLEGEDHPVAALAKLTNALAGLANVTILTRTDAFAVFAGLVRAHQVEISPDNRISTRVVDLVSPRLVLANGVVERLPVFAGNRLPGVVGALAAFHRADCYGIWRGSSALLATAVSDPYRLATLARDAGIAIARAADTRPAAQSRFIEFAKAYGMTLAGATRVRDARPTGRGGTQLAVRLEPVDGTEPASPVTVDTLIACGGWQPDLSLWHMAGGESRWLAASARLEPTTGPAGITLAGAAAGLRSQGACIAHGAVVAATVFGRPARTVADSVIDPLHETPDDPTPVASLGEDTAGPAYLDAGFSLTLRPSPPRPHWWQRRTSRKSPFADHTRALSLIDVVAAVQLGAITSAEAAIVAQERCLIAGAIGSYQRPDAPAPVEPTSALPAFLAGRFGPDPVRLAVRSHEPRELGPGVLIYASSDVADPRAAVGVILGTALAWQWQTLALVAAEHAARGTTLWARDANRAGAITLLEHFTESDAQP